MRMSSILILFIILLIHFLICETFKSHFKYVFVKRNPKLKFSVLGTDIPTIPALIGSVAIVFGVFNLDNQVDLTDTGRAKSRAQKKAEKLVKGDSTLDKGIYFVISWVLY